MNVQQAYNSWAHQYDTNINRTRDLEARALRDVLGRVCFDNCLEIGCGTGKNTVWLAEHARQVTSADLSEEMLAKARAKDPGAHVSFLQTDITRPWDFATGAYDLIGFSLVLEHIEDLAHIFRETAANLVPGGYVYIGELHPFKQYTGSKARFDNDDGSQQVVTCFNHHVSDFTQIPAQYGLQVMAVDEWFDEDDRNTLPRILTVLLRKV